MDKSLNEIAELVGGSIVGEGSVRITGLNSLKEAATGDLSFLGSPNYQSLLDTTNATAILVPVDFGHNALPVVRVEHPYLAFATVLKEYEKEKRIHPVGIDPSASIDETATLGRDIGVGSFVRIEGDSKIGDGVILYSGVYVGRDVTIGPGTIVYPNTTFREGVQVGARCIIHSNTSIGSDGFGFARAGDSYVKIPQVGTVIIHDDVEIGSNSSVDRATTGATVIGKGTKIDNLVQIGHNVTIGKHCTLSGGVGIAGSAKIGDNVAMGGHVGVNSHITIGDNVQIGGGTGVVQSIPANTTVLGYPQAEAGLARRIWAAFPQLPKALRRIRMLEKRLDKLEE